MHIETDIQVTNHIMPTEIGYKALDDKSRGAPPPPYNPYYSGQNLPGSTSIHMQQPHPMSVVQPVVQPSQVYVRPVPTVVHMRNHHTDSSDCCCCCCSCPFWVCGLLFLLVSITYT